MRYKIFSAVALAFSASLASAADPGSDAQKAEGKTLYEKYCTQCHGDKGDGKSPAADRFKPRPRDFTKGKYKVRSTSSGSLPTDEDVFGAIHNGLAFKSSGAYTVMPPWPQLSETQIKNLVYYLKSFSADFADPAYNNPKTVKLSQPLPSSPESIMKGREVFEKNECVKCHGNLGRGNGNSAPTLEDDWENHIRPADLTKRWTFRAGSTKEDIFRTVSSGFNGTPMPSYLDNIPEEDRWHLVNYIFSLSQRDTPNYNQPDNPVMLTPVSGAIDISKHEEALKLFAAAPQAIIPISGQVVEPGREFFPSANEIIVQGVYNKDDLALLLRWHDMSAETSGSNAPDMEVASTEQKKAESTEEKDPFADEEAAPASDDPFAEEESGSAFSDAVALQFPHEKQAGFKLPYFVFGDSGNPVDLWHVDLASKEGKIWAGRGSGSVKATDAKDLAVSALYQDGEWSVIFKRERKSTGGIAFDTPKEFTPVAFSVWDGFNEERGNKRGFTSWFYVYQEPEEKPSVVLPMLMYGLGFLLLELLAITIIKKKNVLK